MALPPTITTVGTRLDIAIWRGTTLREAMFTFSDGFGGPDFAGATIEGIFYPQGGAEIAATITVVRNLTNSVVYMTLSAIQTAAFLPDKGRWALWINWPDGTVDVPIQGLVTAYDQEDV